MSPKTASFFFVSLIGLAAAAPQATTSGSDAVPSTTTNPQSGGFTGYFTTTVWTVQATMTSMIIPYLEGVSPLASVVSAGSAATTFTINCPVGTDGNDCGFGPGVTVINDNSNPSSRGFTYILGAEDDGTSIVSPAITIPCFGISGQGRDLTGTCVEPDDPPQTTTTNLGNFVQDVEVTGGADKLSSAAATGDGSNTATGTGAAATATGDKGSGAIRSGVKGGVFGAVAIVVGMMLW